MRLILLRHGRTAWNAQRRFQGQSDPPLDDVGRMQAYEVAALIASVHPDLLVSSDAARAMQTAELVSAAIGLPVRGERRLRERSLGHWEGLTRDEVAAKYPDEFADWIAGRDVSGRGGESREEVAERA
jgi:broad specificity phosphatase PhoE